MFQVQTGKIETALKVVIYGPEGVGKTTLASQFPNPIFIDTEGSTDHFDVKRLKQPSSFAELLKMIKWVRDERQFSTLVIDTADWAQQLAEDAVKSENGWSSIETPGYGKGYVLTREKWVTMLDKLTEVVESGINVVLTAHSEIKKFEDPKEGNAYDRYELKLAKRSNAHIAGVTKEWADMVLFLNYEVYAVKRDGMGDKYVGQGGQRKIYTSHHPAYDAKNRFDLPESMLLSYEGIAHVVPDLVSTTTITSTSEASEPSEPDVQLPKNLKDLMEAFNVSVDELKAVIALMGHFPINTDLEIIVNTSGYTDSLVANWDGIMSEITKIRQNPARLIPLLETIGDNNAQETIRKMKING